MNLIFSNAMTYNHDQSQVYNDAVALKETFESKLNELAPNGELIVDDSNSQKRMV